MILILKITCTDNCTYSNTFPIPFVYESKDKADADLLKAVDGQKPYNEIQFGGERFSVHDFESGNIEVITLQEWLKYHGIDISHNG